MAIILTDQTGTIITWAAQPWRTPGEYSNPAFRVVLCELLETEKPVAITSFGPATSKTFDTHEGPVVCPRTYESATVETEQIPQEVE
jgi:hypothetical protein